MNKSGTSKMLNTCQDKCMTNIHEIIILATMTPYKQTNDSKKTTLKKLGTIKMLDVSGYRILH